MCQNPRGTDLMLAASGQYWSGSGTAAFLRIIARKDKSHVYCHFCKHYLMRQNYASAEPILSASIGPVHAQFWHIHGMFTKIRFTITYLMTYPAKIISFDNDIVDNHLHIQLMIRTSTCLNTLPTLDGFSVILIFHYWTWKCIESPWLHVTLVLVPRGTFWIVIFLFNPMLIRPKIVDDVKYTCKITHCDPVNVRRVVLSIIPLQRGSCLLGQLIRMQVSHDH